MIDHFFNSKKKIIINTTYKVLKSFIYKSKFPKFDKKFFHYQKNYIEVYKFTGL